MTLAHVVIFGAFSRRASAARVIRSAPERLATVMICHQRAGKREDDGQPGRYLLDVVTRTLTAMR
jgi:hypothetical protein